LQSRASLADRPLPGDVLEILRGRPQAMLGRQNVDDPHGRGEGLERKTWGARTAGGAHWHDITGSDGRRRGTTTMMALTHRSIALEIRVADTLRMPGQS
jgi:hypothetical protein